MPNISAKGKALTITAGHVLWNTTHNQTSGGFTRVIPHCCLADIGLLYDNIGIAPANGLYDVAALCCSSEINPHSLIKPFYATKPYMTPSDMPAGIIEGATTYPYGYSIPYTTLSGTVNSASKQAVLDVLKQQWVFRPPIKDDRNCWKSLAHFHGYDHNAPAPLFPIVSLDVTENSTNKITVWLNNGSNSTTNVHPANFGANAKVPGLEKPFADLRLCVALFLVKGSLVDGDQFIGEGKSNISPVGGSSQMEAVTVTVQGGISLDLGKNDADITIRAIPFYAMKESSNPFANGEFKASALMTQNEYSKEFVIEGFSWAFVDFELVKTSSVGTFYKLRFKAKITRGSGSVIVQHSQLKANIALQNFTEEGSTPIKFENESVRNPESTNLGYTILDNTGNNNVTEATLETVNTFNLYKSGTYGIELFFGDKIKGSDRITI